MTCQCTCAGETHPSGGASSHIWATSDGPGGAGGMSEAVSYHGTKPYMYCCRSKTDRHSGTWRGPTHSMALTVAHVHTVISRSHVRLFPWLSTCVLRCMGYGTCMQAKLQRVLERHSDLLAAGLLRTTPSPVRFPCSGFSQLGTLLHRTSCRHTMR